MTGGERNDNDVAAPPSNFGRADHGIGRVVTALHDHVGLQDSHEVERSILIEHGDGADDFERRQNVDSLTFRPNGSLGSFEPFDRSVAVDADDEHVAAGARTDEYVDVSGMEEIEDAVRKDDAPALQAAPLGERLP